MENSPIQTTEELRAHHRVRKGKASVRVRMVIGEVQHQGQSLPKGQMKPPGESRA